MEPIGRVYLRYFTLVQISGNDGFMKTGRRYFSKIFIMFTLIVVCSCTVNKEKENSDEIFLSLKGVQIKKTGYIIPVVCFNAWVVGPIDRTSLDVRSKKIFFLEKTMPELKKLSSSSMDKEKVAYQIAEFYRENFNHIKKIDPKFFDFCSKEMSAAKNQCTSLVKKSPNKASACLDKAIKQIVFNFFGLP